MPPEVMTQGRVTTATDVYSFGMLMYELAACRLAFSEETAAQIFYMVVNLVSSGDQIHCYAVACWLTAGCPCRTNPPLGATSMKSLRLLAGWRRATCGL